jgi:hypothetical protein
VPIVGLCGDSDPGADSGRMAGWAAFSSVGHSQVTLPGGHFYLDDQLDAVASVIRSSLDEALGQRPGRVGSAKAPVEHWDRVPLGNGGWTVWRDALLRTAGFPVAGLARFSAPQAARAADALLFEGKEGFDSAFAEAAAANSRAAYEVAVDPLVREAVTWQNPGALHALDGLAKGGPVQARNYKRRYREEAAARYWQRYCGKNETVGFFGPICWISLGDRTSIAAGPRLTRERMVFLEYWAVQAFAEMLEGDEALRRLLPPVLKPHLVLDGRIVRHPTRPPMELSAPQAQAVAWCDGARPARDVVDKLGLRRAEDGYLMLHRLVEQGVLNWGFDLPMRYTAEQELREKLEALDDPAAAPALSKLDTLAAARREVEAAAGNPDELKAALSRLDATFAELTGAATRRREGEAYAGRTLCHEETLRDLDVVLGVDVLAELAEPLGVLLQASRWLTSAMADAYEAALRELHAELGGGEVSLGELYWLAQGLFFGTGRPTRFPGSSWRAGSGGSPSARRSRRSSRHSGRDGRSRASTVRICCCAWARGSSARCSVRCTPRYRLSTRRSSCAGTPSRTGCAPNSRPTSVRAGSCRSTRRTGRGPPAASHAHSTTSRTGSCASRTLPVPGWASACRSSR